ncbi:hypothetical protein E2320_013899 [Naja naja]|nr:hypothetical protein E2320_013899 [Naja naja]
MPHGTLKRQIHLEERWLPTCFGWTHRAWNLLFPAGRGEGPFLMPNVIVKILLLWKQTIKNTDCNLLFFRWTGMGLVKRKSRGDMIAVFQYLRGSGKEEGSQPIFQST